MDNKVISVMIPTYNEEENARPIYEAVKNEIQTALPEYDYEILFIDNKSQDSTRHIIESICAEDPKVKAIFNAKNFGQFNSPYYGLIHTTGDCTISLCADFQDPVDTIPRLVHKWEEGYKIVCAIKTQSRENPLMYSLRACYYKFIHAVSSVSMIEQFTGFGLYDKSFIEVLRNLGDSTPFYRGIVPELGFDIAKIEYTQQKRRAGKTSNNWNTLYDAAMLSFTSYTKIFLRLPTILGALLASGTFIGGLIYLIFWGIMRFDVHIGPIILLLCFLAGVQLFFIGMIGEYILGINERMKKRPLVIEEKRLNF
ncbi:MAG: glycosyltransferase family 2 protein [Acutalibacteraceae bacterium]